MRPRGEKMRGRQGNENENRCVRRSEAVRGKNDEGKMRGERQRREL